MLAWILPSLLLLGGGSAASDPIRGEKEVRVEETQEALFQRGREAEKAGRYPEARRMYERAGRPSARYQLNRGESEPLPYHGESCFRLGRLLIEGKGGPRDPRLAARCFAITLGTFNLAPLDAYFSLIRLY